jgi:hypothetical protein
MTAFVAGLEHSAVGFDLAVPRVERARAKTVEFAERVTIKAGDLSHPPIEPASVEVILARHILWPCPTRRQRSPVGARCFVCGPVSAG